MDLIDDGKFPSYGATFFMVNEKEFDFQEELEGRDPPRKRQQQSSKGMRTVLME